MDAFIPAAAGSNFGGFTGKVAGSTEKTGQRDLVIAGNVLAMIRTGFIVPGTALLQLAQSAKIILPE